jgi:aldose 1-epimerase
MGPRRAVGSEPAAYRADVSEPASAPSTHALTSGTQYALASGDYTADIASVGASVRTLRHEGRDLILPYDAEEIRPGFRGCVLAPWPNRIAHGRWSWNGESLQLAITEPERGHALHGLAVWSDWDEVALTGDAVTLETPIVAQPGYPYRLRLTVRWSLHSNGLRCDLTVTNEDQRAAPFGCSIHPYFVAPTGPLDDWTLHVAADAELMVDETSIPTELVTVLPDHDFREPRPIGRATIDHTFTGFPFDDGTQSVTLTDSNGDGARITFGRETPWVQVCTSDWPELPGHRAGVAIEPMTCPPNAFATHEDVIAIAPGAVQHRWWHLAAVTSGRFTLPIR